jgi:carotenoid cleavage dioxygenase-like enzyme
VVWLDLPVVFDMDLVGHGMPYRWDDGYGARLGVMPKRGGQVQWFDVDPCYVFHVGNAREEEHGRVVVDAVRYTPGAFAGLWTRMRGSAGPAIMTGGSALHRWELDWASGVVKEEGLDDRAVEFPTINESRTGLANRYVYAAADDAIVKYDFATDTRRTYETGSRRPGEAVFVPASGGGDAAGEDDGWLLSIIGSEHEAELLVLDASDLAEVASVRLPRRVPLGFHGSWLPGE